MKFIQPPLLIDCDGLSRKLIEDLADRLSLCFEEVKIWGDEITAYKPLGGGRYDAAWNIIDKFGVKAF